MTSPAEAPAQVSVVWVTGASCDGCSVAVLGDASTDTIEDLIRGKVEGLPPIRIIHPLLAVEEGDRFIGLMRAAAAGELQPYLLVVETSVPIALATGSYAWLGEDRGRPLDLREWIVRLAAHAEAVIAIGDCAVYGGPHSLDEPSSPTGVESVVGFRYRSRAGLPVIHLPGCSVPPVFIATLVAVMRYVLHQGPKPELDELGRPAFAYVS